MLKTVMPGMNKGPIPLSFSDDVYEAVCIPPVPEDLSLSKLEVVNGKPQNTAFQGRVVTLLRQYCDAEKIFATNVSTASAKIISPDELHNKVQLGLNINLYNNLSVPAAGTQIKPREGFIMNTKGCPVLLVRARSYFFPLHGGRDEFIDRHRITTGEKSREHESIIHAVVKYLLDLGVHPSEIHIQGLFGLHPQTFDHAFDDPIYGELNQKMAAELNRKGAEVIKEYNDGKHKFVLGTLIRLQASECGIPATQVGYSHRLPVKGHYATNSKDPRSNLVIITHKAAKVKAS